MILNLGIEAWATWTSADGPPAGAMFSSRLRRRTSILTRACAKVLAEATTQSGDQLADLPTVFASAYGEIDTTIALWAMMHDDDGALSPTRFHNSVHNTASGYISIAGHARGFSTAIAAGEQTVAMALVEAAGVVHGGAPRVAVVLADERIPEPFAPTPAFGSLAVGFVIGRARPQSKAMLESIVDDEAPASASIPVNTTGILALRRWRSPPRLPVAMSVRSRWEVGETEVIAVFCGPGGMDDVPPRCCLLPHGPPMVLLDRVCEATHDTIVCAATVCDDNPFCRNGRVRAVVSLEYMAQATGAWLGYQAHLQGLPVGGGMLLGSREMKLAMEYLHVGDELVVRASHVWGHENMSNFACVLKRGASEVATASINVLRRVGAWCLRPRNPTPWLPVQAEGLARPRPLSLDVARLFSPGQLSYKMRRLLAMSANGSATTEEAATCLGFDVGDGAEVRKHLQAYADGEPFIGVVVNNAGVVRDAPFPSMTEADWRLVMRTTLDGFFHVTQPLVMPMVRRRWGRIINMASISGLTGNRGQTNYAAAKAGIIGATRSLARELAKRKVTVNAVAPGLIDTDMIDAVPVAEAVKSIPMRRLGTADEVAKLVGFLASDDAAYITGQVFGINGGMA